LQELLECPCPISVIAIHGPRRALAISGIRDRLPLVITTVIAIAIGVIITIGVISVRRLLGRRGRGLFIGGTGRRAAGGRGVEQVGDQIVSDAAVAGVARSDLGRGDDLGVGVDPTVALG
jgi:hypothetical protein